MSVADLRVFELARYRSVEALCELLANRHAKRLATVLLAGGTDWLVEREMARTVAPGEQTPLVVDVSRMQELRGIELSGDTLRIGAATTYLEMRRSEVVRQRAPLIERMARDIGAVQIQARGTLGGNLATGSPAADGVAALAAYDAVVVVRSARGERGIPLAELQTGYKRTSRAPDELIVAVDLSLAPAGSPWIWRKVGTRRAQAISKVALAGIAEFADGRATRFGLGMASVAPVTARMVATRALVLSRPLAEIGAADVASAVERDVTPIDDVRSTRAYRLHSARAVTALWLRELGAKT